MRTKRHRSSQFAFATIAVASATQATADFVPGRIYVPSERFVYEYDLDLNLTRTISMVGIHRGSTGAAFSPSGNLVYIANILEPDGVFTDRTSVIEVDSTGAIVREFDLTQFGIRSGQSVEFSPTTGYFAVSDAGSVLYLDQQLNLVASSERLTTQLIDGIAVMPDGRLVLSESASTSSLWVLNEDLTLADRVPASIGVGGMAALDNETVVVPSIRRPTIDLINIETDERELLFELFFEGFSYRPTDVTILPSGEFLFVSQGGVLAKISPNGSQQLFSTPLGQVAPSLAYFVPSPPVAATAFGMVLFTRRRRSP